MMFFSSRVSRLILLIFYYILSISVSEAAPMGFAEAQHLLARTAFHASFADVQIFAQRSREQAVQTLITHALHDPLQTRPPEWTQRWAVPPKPNTLSDDEKKQGREMNLEQGRALRAWWLQEITETSAPLREKMTLFWHNHFVSSLQKVKNPQWMWQQNKLFRREAIGSFRVLLHDILRDGAMLLYLDAVNNRQGQPNENLARELLELFTLGTGHYTEQDIREVARALTGLSLDREVGTVRFVPRQHDSEDKIIFGQKGNWDSEAVVRLILNRPETAEWIVTKLWHEFVSPEIDSAMIQKLAHIFRQNDYQLQPVLTALLTSDAFYAAQYRGVLIKSPIELIAGSLKQFSLHPQDYGPFAMTSAALGQNLLAPPNVRGWVGGTLWINTETLARRQQWLQRLLRAEEMRTHKKNPDPRQDLYFDVQKWWQPFANSEQAIQFLLVLKPTTPIGKTASLETIQQIINDPVYQLK